MSKKGSSECDWLKMMNPAAPAARREAEEEWGRWSPGGDGRMASPFSNSMGVPPAASREAFQGTISGLASSTRPADTSRAVAAELVRQAIPSEGISLSRHLVNLFKLNQRLIDCHGARCLPQVSAGYPDVVLQH